MLFWTLIFPGCIGREKSQDTSLNRNHGLLPSAARTWNIFKFLSRDAFPKIWHNVQFERSRAAQAQHTALPKTHISKACVKQSYLCVMEALF